jgi:hypothetical protein
MMVFRTFTFVHLRKLHSVSLEVRCVAFMRTMPLFPCKESNPFSPRTSAITALTSTPAASAEQLPQVPRTVVAQCHITADTTIPC